MRRNDKATEQPAVVLPSLMTEQDRAIVARREAGETQKAIASSLGVPVSRVKRAEWRGEWDAKGRKLLAEHLDSIEGLRWIGALDRHTAFVFSTHHERYGGAELTRLSEIAAFGLDYWASPTAFPDLWENARGTGDRRPTQVSHLLALLGIAWSPVDRTPQPKPRQQETNSAPQPSGWWNEIVRHVRDLEQSTGTGALRDCPGRDSEQGIALRLAFLNGYLESKLRRERETIDVTPDDAGDQDDSRQDLETAGNLVCLPGVSLSSVLHGGDDPEPRAP